MQNLSLLPQPRKLHLTGEVLNAVPNKKMRLVSPCPNELFFSAARLQAALRTSLGVEWEITASPLAVEEDCGIVIIQDARACSHPQGYTLQICPTGMTLRAAQAQGIFYGVCTLAQILSQSGSEIPCLETEDWPDFLHRGVMLDISRDKVYTLSTLFDLVDMLAGWKVNELQLYTEHTFAYLQHPTVWKDASPITGEDILRLDTFCRQRFIELVPNQNSFAHMERWLKHPEYIHLAETTQDFEVPWGTHSAPFSLAPVHPGSFKLVQGLYDELLPHFTSRQCNVGCDETFDVGYGQSQFAVEERGKGKVFLDFLLKIYHDLERRGVKMQYWGDMALHYDGILPMLPRDATALIWGYEADHPFDAQSAKFAKQGIPFYVCPGTSSWCSLAGRTFNCLENLSGAARGGRLHHAEGYLNTDWGDLGHWQVLPVSYLGLGAGAATSWCLDSHQNLEVTIADAISRHAFKDSSGSAGKLYFELGNLVETAGLKFPNSSVLFWILQFNREKILAYRGVNVSGLYTVLEKLDELQSLASSTQIARPDAVLLSRETALTVRLLRHACRRGLWLLDENSSVQPHPLKSDLQEILEEYRSVWLARNRPGGLKDSAARLEAHLQEYA